MSHIDSHINIASVKSDSMRTFFENSDLIRRDLHRTAAAQERIADSLEELVKCANNNR